MHEELDSLKKSQKDINPSPSGKGYSCFKSDDHKLSGSMHTKRKKPIAVIEGPTAKKLWIAMQDKERCLIYFYRNGRLEAYFT